MINYDYVTKENIKYDNLNWPLIPDHPSRVLIIGGYGSGKTNILINLIKIQDDDDYSIIDKICFPILHYIQMKRNINILLKRVKKWSSKSERSKDFY